MTRAAFAQDFLPLREDVPCREGDPIDAAPRDFDFGLDRLPASMKSSLDVPFNERLIPLPSSSPRQATIPRSK